ncbi:hypothetical protein EVAR_55916_1 [Eumeta japonica]|uniref:Uncharacterized protein n=1 Tax=Eumeta variegata TaxID=151549 RepID=A0A4C1YVC5_EUMVA|nr:hypothetical protein EVAR_55916_1 [Eumeta japonica]
MLYDDDIYGPDDFGVEFPYDLRNSHQLLVDVCRSTAYGSHMHLEGPYPPTQIPCPVNGSSLFEQVTFPFTPPAQRGRTPN